MLRARSRAAAVMIVCGMAAATPASDPSAGLRVGPESVRGAEWPQYQGGPARTGHAAPFRPALEPAWTADLRDDVYASPVISGGRVFVVSYPGVVTAWLADGRLAWRSRIPGRVYASTPATGGGALYVGAITGNRGALFALATDDGAVTWTATLPGKVFAPPLLAGGRVILGGDDGAVRAFAAADGRPLWTRTTGGAIHDNGAAAAGGLVIVGSQDGVLRGLDPATGAERWTFRARKRINTTPSVSDGVVFLGEEDGTCYALDADTGAPRWSYRTGGPVQAAPAAAPGLVVFASADGWVTALDRRGNKRWAFRAGPHVVSSPVIAGGLVFSGAIDSLALLDQIAYGLDAADGSVAWRAPLKGPLFASPALGDGLLVLVTKKGRVYAFRGTDAPSGAP